MEQFSRRLTDVRFLIDENAPKVLLPHQYYYPQISTISDRYSNEKKEAFFKRLSESSNEKKEIMVYVHIPFCDSHCKFCSFDKAYNLDEVSAYISKIVDEVEFYSRFEYFRDTIVTSIHIGESTPTLLLPEQFDEIINSIYKYFTVKKDCIINIEGSATTLYQKPLIDFIKSSNISRVSVGVQTFDEKTRKFYNSYSTLEQVWQTLTALKKSNIVTYIDIMYGYPLYDIEYSDYKRVIKDINIAISQEVEGIEFGQLYPYYNNIEQLIKNENLRFECKQQLFELMNDASEIMLENGYTQQTEYGFIQSRGEIILEKAYYGNEGALIDCLALGSSAFGCLAGWKYRNLFYTSYLNRKSDVYLQIKKLNEYENKMCGIVGFPKLLEISKRALERIADYKNIRIIFYRLLEKGMLEEQELYYKLSPRGKLYIDNIYMALLSEEERKKLVNTVKIHVME